VSSQPQPSSKPWASRSSFIVLLCAIAFIIDGILGLVKTFDILQLVAVFIIIYGVLTAA